MKIEIPDNLTEEQKEAIAAAITVLMEHGGNLVLDHQEVVKQGLYARFVEWWYGFWRGIGFS